MDLPSSNFIFTSFLFIVLFSSLTFAATPFKKCKDVTEYSQTKGVTVKGCDSEPCQLAKGTNVTIEIDFIANEDTKTVKAAVYGEVKGIPIPFPFEQPDACKNSGLTCPIKNRNSYNYKAVIGVKKAYPDLQVLVKWELKDDNGNFLVCVVIPCRITG